MKNKILLLFTLIFFSFYSVYSLTIQGVEFQTNVSNTTLDTTRAVNVTSVNLEENYILLNNFTFEDGENFTDSDNTIKNQISTLNWSEEDKTIDTDSFLHYFRFNQSGTLLENWTFGGFDSLTNQLTLFFEAFGSEGNKTFTWEKPGYVSQEILVPFSYDAFNNITYNTTQSSITINIKDKNTLNLITGVNFTAEFIATVGATTSTTNGTISLSNLFFLNEEYTAIISNENYQTESLFFTFTNQEALEIDVFMIEKNDTQLGQVFIEAVDRFSQPIVGATVEALQWNPSTSSYERVSTSKTGSDGTGALNIILEDKSYIFRATSNGAVGTIDEGVIESSENGKTITIVVSDTTSEENYLLQNVFTNVTQSFNNVTNISTVTFEWQDLEGLSQEICINAYRRIATTDTLISENCISGASGTYMQSFFINSSYTTILKGEVKVNGEDLITIKSFKFDPEDHPSTLFELNGLHLVIIPVLFLVSIAAGMFMENIYIGTFLLMISSGLSLLLAPTLTNGGITAFFFFLGFMIIRSGVKIK